MADMSREEAARVLTEKAELWEGVLKHMVPAGDFSELKQIEDYKTALRMGAAALRGWVKTADRLPEEPDDSPFIVYMEGWFENPYDAVRVWTAGEIRYIPEEVIAYMPLPPLPEVEE